jgi:hypothetical protein
MVAVAETTGVYFNVQKYFFPSSYNFLSVKCLHHQSYRQKPISFHARYANQSNGLTGF